MGTACGGGGGAAKATEDARSVPTKVMNWSVFFIVKDL